MTSKDTDDGTNDTEHVDYEYNLQGRLKQITTTPYDGSGNPTTPEVTTQYKYNPQGIRIEKSVDGVLTKYLIDPYNHTGYAQVLEETTGTGANLTRIQYTLGDDVISQTESTSTDSGANWTPGNTEYLLYDGHGSTRQLADDAGAILTDQNFSYDAYGVMLGSAANPESTAGTNLLYAGEQYDPDFSGYYNRARYYNPSNGRFNRTDPYGGSPQDPQSLHKYTYVHNNLVNNIDPSGMMTMLSMTIRGAISGLIMGISLGYIEGVKKTGEWFSAKHLAYMAIYGLAGLAIGAAVGAALGYIVSGGGGLVSINGTGAYGVFTRTVGKILDQALRIGSSQLGSLSLKLFLTGVVFGALTYAFTPDEFSDPISSSVFWSYVGTSGATAFLWELLKITGMVASRAFPGGWFVLPYAFVLGLNVGYFVPKGIHEGYDLISDFWMWIEDGIED